MEGIVLSKVNNIVKVKTAIGTFHGQWCSPNPIDFKRYILELDADETLSPEKIIPSNKNVPYIENFKQGIILNGLVEEIQDGILILRLYNNLLMLEVTDAFDYSIFLDKYVCILLQKVNLYDTGLC